MLTTFLQFLSTIIPILGSLLIMTVVSCSKTDKRDENDDLPPLRTPQPPPPPPSVMRRKKKKEEHNPPPPPTPPPNIPLTGSGKRDDITLKDVQSLEYEESSKKKKTKKRGLLETIKSHISSAGTPKDYSDRN